MSCHISDDVKKDYCLGKCDCRLLQGSNFLLITKQVNNWYEARYQCHGYGAELAYHRKKLSRIKNLLENEKSLYFIGLRKEDWLPFHHEENRSEIFYYPSGK